MTLNQLKRKIEENNFQFEIENNSMILNYRFNIFKIQFNFEIKSNHIFRLSDILIIESKINRSIFNSDIYEILNILNNKVGLK